MDEKLQRAQSLVGTSEGRPQLDYYPTPPAATRALLDAESFEGPIWEPACGEGHMSDVLMAGGHEVISTDISDYGYQNMDGVMDFLDAPDDLIVPNLITNPPFSVVVGHKEVKDKETGEITQKPIKKGCEVFVEQALKHTTGKVAILQKLAFLEGKERKKMFESTPFKACHVFSRRLTMYREGEKMKNSGMIAFAWFVWEHGYTGDPVIRWIDHSKY